AVDDLVDAVVDDLPEQVVVAARVGAADVHRRSLADRLQPLEDLDVLGGVSGGHQLTPAGVKVVTLMGWGTTFTVIFLPSATPLPPRLPTERVAGPISTVLPAAVSTTSGASPLPCATARPITRSPSPTRITVTPRPGLARRLISAAGHSSTCARSVTTQTTSF